MNIALITAGGTGNRMGQDIPKQFMTIDNQPVIIYTLQAFQYCDEIDSIAVVCLKGWEVVLQSYANQFGITKLKWIFEGGETGQDSICRGLIGLKDAGCNEDDIIVVHDGVRPLVSSEIIRSNVEICKRFGYAVTGLICKEVIMELVDGNVADIGIPRERLVRTQTPHTYFFRSLYESHLRAKEMGISAVACCDLMPKLGINDQHLVIGSEKNGLKLTRPEDVELFKAMKNTSPEPWMKEK